MNIKSKIGSTTFEELIRDIKDYSPGYSFPIQVDRYRELLIALKKSNKQIDEKIDLLRLLYVWPN